MSHKSYLGSFGDRLPCDLQGYVPQRGDKPEDFIFEDDIFTADFDAYGNGYKGCAHDLWADFVDKAVQMTFEASSALSAEYSQPTE